MKKVREGAFSFEDRVWSTISDNAKSFIRSLLTYRPDERPSAEQALQHPWLTELATLQVDEALAMNALDNLNKFNSDADRASIQRCCCHPGRTLAIPARSAGVV